MTDPTTLLGTLVSLKLQSEDKEERKKQDAEDARTAAKEQSRKISSGSYTDFTNWSKIERPRVASLLPNNNYLSALAISGEQYLRSQAKLNPNAPFNNPN